MLFFKVGKCLLLMFSLVVVSIYVLTSSVRTGGVSSWVLTQLDIRNNFGDRLGVYEKRVLSRSYNANSSLVYVLEEFTGGLGIIVLHMYLCAFMAEEANIPFHLIVKKSWHYGFFFDLTIDYTRSTKFPIVMHYENEIQRAKYPGLPWNISNDTIAGAADLINRTHFVIPVGANWQYIIDYNYRKNCSENCLFGRLQLLAQSMWILNSVMEEQIKFMRILMFGENRPFIAVHIRGGLDKVGREMDFIPICEYVRRVSSLRHKLPSNGSLSVFVFSNDFDLTVEFKRQLIREDSSWRVFGWGDGMELLEKVQSWHSSSFLPRDLSFSKIQDSHRKVHNLLFNSASEENKYHTHEVVSALSLARYSSYLVCSMNSNLCKLSALLRNGDLSTFVPVDNAVWMETWRAQMGFRSNCTDDTKFKSWCDDVSPNHVNCKTLLRNGTIVGTTV